jgi:hypothetical protein
MNFSFNACGYLYEKYKDKRRWKEALDVMMVAVDLAMNLTPKAPGMAGRDMITVAQTLENLCRFKEAADVYEQVGESFSSDFRPDDRARPFEYCAVAHERTGDMAAAEPFYVKALYMRKEMDGRTWNLNESTNCRLLTNMCVFYYDWLVKVKKHNERLEEGPEPIEPALLAILFTAGFRPDGDKFNQLLVLNHGKSYQTYLKRELCTKKAAKNALVSALSQDDLKNFRSTLIGCFKPNVKIPRVGDVPRPKEEEKTSVPSTPMADTSVGDENATAICDNPGCGKKGKRYGENALLGCPCKLVFYCGRDCQVANWKAHRSTCPHHLAKQRGKKGSTGDSG